MREFWPLILLLGVGCSGRIGLEASTMGWIRVETEDLVIQTDINREKAVWLAANYQRLRTAIAENEFPCAFERSNVPTEFVLLKDPQDIENLAGRHTAGFSAYAPSSHLDAKLQLVMAGRQAAKDTQLFVHELTHGAVDPDARRSPDPDRHTPVL